MSNRLAHSTSPYLLQHAENPVDWQEFSPEAFRQAQQRDVPVLLSVGYAACHWCHVMAHESFEDPAVGEYVNEHFVAVKVDREERPDVDATYMAATQLLTRQGGWPMTVFLTPQGKAFHAGTYYPPRPAHGRPSFLQVLQAVQDAWHQRRRQVDQGADQVSRALAGHGEAVESMLTVQTPEGAEELGIDALTGQWLDALDIVRDVRHEGFGTGAKFPPSPLLEALCLLASLSPETGAASTDRAAHLLDATLDAVVTGALQDHVGGGFFRYSVTPDWGLPHYEKMLYDNAQLLRVLALEAHRLERLGTDPARAARYRHAATATAQWLGREMLTEQGAFASSLDADSEPATEGGEREGAYYTFDRSVTDPGATPMDPEPVTARWGETGRITGILDESVRSRLWQLRRDRVAPDRDDKVVTAWNGMAVEALAQAGVLLERPEWVELAREAAEHVWTTHRMAGTGLLRRTSRHGRPDGHPGGLEDHARFGLGLLMLHRATGDARWYRRSRELAGVTVEHFVTGQRVRDVAETDPVLATAGSSGAADPFDDVAASATSSLARWLVELGVPVLVGQDVAGLLDRLTAATPGLVARAAQAAGGAVLASALREWPPRLLQVVGASPQVYEQVLDTVGRRRVTDVLVLEEQDAPYGVPARHESGSGQHWSVWLCRDGVCELPVHDLQALEEMLEVSPGTSPA